MTSIRDIAKHAGTSVSAVSRAINNTGYVSDGLRQRIETAVRELNYHPNAGARALRSGKSKLVGVLLPALDVDFFARLAHRIEQNLFNAGYQALICSTAEDSEHEASYLRTLVSKQIDGLIVAAVGSGTDQLREMSDRGVPVVAVDRNLEGVVAAYVGSDHETGGRLVAEHILSLGHQRIAIIGAPEHSDPVQLRASGMRQALAKAGIHPSIERFGPDHSVDACETLCRDILMRGERPSAILATSDIAAIGVMRAARAQGLSLPDELSVTGFDDMPAARYVWPELTTISQPVTAIADHAVEALLSRIREQDIERIDEVKLPVALVKRGSTIRHS